MNWDKLPPLRIEDCKHRKATEPGPSDGGAVCNLLIDVGVPREHGKVMPDACSACLGQFPPAPDCWNEVIASLIYVRSCRALASVSLSPEERARLVQLRHQATIYLPEGNGPSHRAEQLPESKAIASSLWELLPPPKSRGRPEVKKWVAAVLTSPRRQPTLDTTLDSLSRAGWSTPYLFMDGTVRVPPRFAHLPGVLREPRVGCWPNSYLALAELLMRHPDADAYLLAQDDVRFYDAEPLREYLEQVLWPTKGRCLVSLYCPSIYSAPAFAWQAIAQPWTLGAQALVFPRGVAQDLLLDRAVCNHRWKGWREGRQGLANTDVVIGKWAWRKQIPIWYPTPSLVQHIGVKSTLTPKYRLSRERVADRWAGSLILPKRS